MEVQIKPRVCAFCTVFCVRTGAQHGVQRMAREELLPERLQETRETRQRHRKFETRRITAVSGAFVETAAQADRWMIAPAAAVSSVLGALAAAACSSVPRRA